VVDLSPDQFSPILRERMARPMFVSVRNKLGDWNLVPHMVKFLCLTGGTSMIPEFEEVCRKTALLWPNTQRVVTPEHIRLNVVRGAARRSGLRVRGRLPYAIQSVWEDDEDAVEEVFPLGAVPGARKSLKKHFASGQGLRLELRLASPDDGTMSLFAHTIVNNDLDPDGLWLRVEVEYGSQRVLRLRMVWLTTPEIEELPWMTLQQLPSD
jgi:hypothetical protein